MHETHHTSVTVPTTSSTTLDATVVQERWSEIIEQVTNEQRQVVVQQGGCPVAAIIPIDELVRLKRQDEERAARFAVLDEISAKFANVPVEELEAEVAKAVATARTAVRQERLRQLG